MENKNDYKITFFLLSLYRGGGERAVIDLMKMFCDRGYEVHLILMEQGGEYFKQVDPRIKLFDLRSKRIIQTLPRLVRYLSKEKPKALFSISKHTHLISIWARLISRTDTKAILRIGIPFSLNPSGSTNPREFLVPFLIRSFYKYADAIIANSRGVRDDLLKTIPSISKGRVLVIYTPKDIRKIQDEGKEEISEPWFQGPTPVIVSVGRLSDQKNFELLVDTFYELREEIPAHLIIIGSGGNEGSLRKKIKEYNLENSIKLITEHINPYPYMTQADVFVSTSRWEGLPNVHIEALACGAPVISTDCTWGPREILAPDTQHVNRVEDSIDWAEFGVLVPEDNRALLKEALKQILTDKSLQNTYKKRAIKRAEDFDISKIGNQYEKVID